MTDSSASSHVALSSSRTAKEGRRPELGAGGRESGCEDSHAGARTSFGLSHPPAPSPPLLNSSLDVLVGEV